MRPAESARPLPLALAACCAATLFACASVEANPAAGSGKTTPARAAAAPKPAGQQAAKSDSNEVTGLFVPGAPVEITLWPEAYRGELVLLEVAAHGSRVEAGQVIARLDAAGIERELADARLALLTAEGQDRSTRMRHQLADEAAAARLERAREALARAERNLEDWKQTELDFARRGDALSAAWDAARIADQEDELEQLELMYGADELTDATEDLVLMRTRRDLELSRTRTELSAAQRAYQEEVKRADELTQRETALAKQRLELEHLERTLKIESEDRKLAREKGGHGMLHAGEKVQRLERDRELFTVLAPTAGVLLHGAVDAYRPGSVPAHLRRGSKLAPRSAVAHVAQAASGGATVNAVVLELSGDRAAKLRDGARAAVTVPGRSKPVEGALALPDYPEPGKGGSVWRARVELDEPLEGVRAGMSAQVDLGDPR